MNDIYDVITQRRTIRKFLQKEIKIDILKKIVNAARLAPSAANRQPIEYIIVNNHKLRKEIFKYLNWAAYIEPEGTPKNGEEPMSYVVYLINKDFKKNDYYKIDCGASVENLVLAALNEGVGSCIVGSCDRDKIREILNIGDKYKIEFLVALGYLAENPIAEDTLNNDIKYYRDSSGRLHIPKRSIKKVLYFNKLKKE